MRCKLQLSDKLFQTGDLLETDDGLVFTPQQGGSVRTLFSPETTKTEDGVLTFSGYEQITPAVFDAKVWRVIMRHIFAT